MSSLLHHIYFLQNLLNKGVPSDDTRISNRLVSHAIKQSRSRLLKIKLDKGDYISESNYQKLCIPLEQHAFHDCDCITDNQDCLILRSTEIIPKYLVAKWGPAIQALYLGGKRIPWISITSNAFAQYSLTANDKAGCFLEEDRLFILNNIKLATVILKGIWEDPEEILDYNTASCQEDDCSDFLSEEFPIDAELVYPMYQMAIQLLGLNIQFPEDTRNDGKAVETVQYKDPNEEKK